MDSCFFYDLVDIVYTNYSPKIKTTAVPVEKPFLETSCFFESGFLKNFSVLESNCYSILFCFYHPLSYASYCCVSKVHYLFYVVYHAIQ